MTGLTAILAAFLGARIPMGKTSESPEGFASDVPESREAAREEATEIAQHGAVRNREANGTA